MSNTLCRARFSETVNKISGEESKQINLRIYYVIALHRGVQISKVISLECSKSIYFVEILPGSRSTIDPPTFIKSHHHRNKEVNNNQSTVNKSLPEVESESDDDDDDDYVIPNERRESLRRTRSSSESRLDTINHEKGK